MSGRNTARETHIEALGTTNWARCETSENNLHQGKLHPLHTHRRVQRTEYDSSEHRRRQLRVRTCLRKLP